MKEYKTYWQKRGRLSCRTHGIGQCCSMEDGAASAIGAFGCHFKDKTNDQRNEAAWTSHFDILLGVVVFGLGGLSRCCRRTAEHASLVRPVVDDIHQGPEHHIASVHLEGQELIFRTQGFVDAPKSDHCPQVAASSHQGGHHGQLLWVHEGHNTVAGALGHLHEEGEEDEHDEGNIPGLSVVHTGEGEEHDSLAEEGDELHPDATLESDLGEGKVAADAAQGSSEEVHQTEASSKNGSITTLHLEVCPEVGGQFRIHGQLSAEAGRVLEDHHDDSEVLQHLHIVHQRSVLLLASLGNQVALRSGSVPAEKLQRYSTEHEQDRRHNHGHPPGRVGAHAHCFQWHNQTPDDENLGDTSSQVAPSSRRGVGRADH
mmetsp:Transcript_37878/g.56585  ORF Transcript_37878/g.56585 Transcript_37878/m.56585 type:complete len:372 (+) Transcript_37878:497-1612(+)